MGNGLGMKLSERERVARIFARFQIGGEGKGIFTRIGKRAVDKGSGRGNGY